MAGERQSAQLCATLEQVMREQPQQWSRYYHGTPHQQYLDRHYSLSDRVRYYWPQPQVQQAVDGLLDNLRRSWRRWRCSASICRSRRGR